MSTMVKIVSIEWDSLSGMACGPVGDGFVVEAKLEVTSPKGIVSKRYLSAVFFDEFVNLYQKKYSVFKRIMELDEDLIGTEYANLEANRKEFKECIQYMKYGPIYDLLYKYHNRRDLHLEGKVIELLTKREKLLQSREADKKEK